MIQGLDKIQSPKLQKDITQLYNELQDAILNEGGRVKSISTTIHSYVLGLNRPICICDGVVHYNTVFDRYDIEVLVDYRVTHGYKPYQSLDKPLHIYFTISKQIARDNKIKTILND